MEDTILIGRGNMILEVAAQDWRKHLAGASHDMKTTFSFMTEEHHLVRNFVVCGLPRNHGKPLKGEDIAQRLNLPLARVIAILEDLHKGLFFLVQDNAREVNWAFPVTSDRTPHYLSFSTG